MSVVGINRWKVAATALASVELVCGPVGTVLAGDTITFSGQKGKVDLPSANVKNQEPFKPFDFLEHKGSGKGPVELPQMPSLSPSGLSSKRMRELEKYRDQQKNWIFMTTDDLKTTTTPDEALGVEDFSVEAQTQKPKKVIEKYWDNMGKDSQSKSNRVAEGGNATANLDPDNLDDNLKLRPATPSSLDPGVRTALGKTPERGGTQLIDQLRSAEALTHSFGDISVSRSLAPESLFPAGVSAGSNDRLDPARAQAREEEFKKLILSPEGGSSGSGSRDPINASVDQTRQPLHPVMAGSGADPGFNKGPLDQLPRLNNLGRAAGGSGFDFLNTRAVGPSSLSPAVIAPFDSGFISSRPAILDIPKRRF